MLYLHEHLATMAKGLRTLPSDNPAWNSQANMVYILNLKGPVSFVIQYLFSLYRGLNRGPSDTNVPLCLPTFVLL